MKNTKVLKQKTVLFPELSFKIVGILFEVRKDLGQFLNEKQYYDAIEGLLKKNNISYEREKIIPVSFESEKKGRNKVDFLIENKIILEVKAKRMATKDDYYQTKRYLSSFKKKLAILVNMRDYAVTPKRIINTELPEKEKDYTS